MFLFGQGWLVSACSKMICCQKSAQHGLFLYIVYICIAFMHFFCPMEPWKIKDKVQWLECTRRDIQGFGNFYFVCRNKNGMHNVIGDWVVSGHKVEDWQKFDWYWYGGVQKKTIPVVYIIATYFRMNNDLFAFFTV